MLRLPRLLCRGWAWSGNSLGVSMMLTSSPAVAQISRAPDTFDYLSNREPQDNRPFNFENLKTKSRLWAECRRDLKVPSMTSRNRVINNIKLCASPTLLEAPEVRVQLAEDLWEELRKSGMQPDTAIYNILLRVYDANDHTFAPSEFLEKMKEDNVSPNLGTFKHLMGAYCKQGKMGAASKLLEHMQKMDMALSEPVYASLVTGHARAGSMENAEKVLETMKMNKHVPHNVVYTSLLCAYAERGQMEDINKVYERMSNERLFPSVVTYIHVMNTLSKHGHGALVHEIITKLKNKQWLSSDIRVLCCNCLSRGELVAPRIFLSELSTSQSLTANLLHYYMSKCLEAGHTVSQIVEDLKKDVDLQQYPKFYTDMVDKILSISPSHQLKLSIKNTYPDQGALAPHLWGDRWSQSLREALHGMKENAEGELQSFYFYPLLARHCSDVDLDGLEVSVQQMIMDDVYPITSNVSGYVDKAFTNAGTTFDDYYSSQIADVSDKGRKVLFVIFYKCCLGEFAAALKLVEKIAVEDMPKVESDTLLMSLKSGINYVKLYNMSNSDRVTLVGTIISLFQALEDKGVEVPARNYARILRFRYMWNPKYFSKVFDQVMAKPEKLTNEDYVELFKTAVSMRDFSKAMILHASLPAAYTESSLVRSLYIMCLCGMKNWNEAIHTVNNTLDEGLELHHFVWERIIPFAYKQDATIGENLLSVMKQHGCPLSIELRHRLLRVHVEKEDVEQAEQALKEIQDEKMDNSLTYELMLDLWAYKGSIGKIRELQKADLFPGESSVVQTAIVRALLVNRQLDEALETLRGVAEPSRNLLIYVLKVFILLNRPMEVLVSTITKCGISSDYLHTLMFFTFLDIKKHAEASAILKKLKQLDPKEVKIRMSKPEAGLYRRFMKLNYHPLAPESSALSGQGSAIPEEGSSFSGQGSAIPEEGSSLSGQGSAIPEEGSSLSGQGSALPEQASALPEQNITLEELSGPFAKSGV